MEAFRLESSPLHQPTVLADVSNIQEQLRAAERLRALLTRGFGPTLATDLMDRALAHESLRGSEKPASDLRGLVVADLLGRIGEVLVASAPQAWDEQQAEAEQGRSTRPETPQAIDRSEVRRALS